MSVLNNSNAISTGGAYNLESSLRFRSSASAYLTRTLSASGTTNTWSFWVKRGKLSSAQSLFDWSDGVSTSFGIGFTSSDTLDFYNYSSAYTMRLVTTQLFRDPSAWYHIVVVMDTTNATASDRARIYVNGNRVTTFSTATYPTQNLSLNIATSRAFDIGAIGTTHAQNFDGYMTEFNFVDGQALTPSDFGSYDGATGVWKPKKYAGTYGTNGFYLPMKETQQATGFNTVLWTGNGGTQSITGVGFSPDLVWYKCRSNGSTNHIIIDSVRGTSKYLSPNQTIAEGTATNTITSFDNDGFALGSDGSGNFNGRTNVGWCWDAGSSTVSNTDGTITSSVRANPATGFSIVTYTGTGSAGTIGHGLGASPKFIIVKDRSATNPWAVYHDSLGVQYYIFLNTTDAAYSNLSDYWSATAPSSTVFGTNSYGGTNTSGHNYVAYCFSEVAGFSKFGSYTGTSGDITVNCGFRPAFVMVKNTSSTGNWEIHDNTRHPSVATDTGYSARLRANDSSAEAGFNDSPINFTDTGFVLDSSVTGNSYVDYDNNGNTYIYMAFADTRDAQFNFDASGNKNNWTANNINSNASSETTYDIMNDVATLTDEDTANFATLNPLNNIPYGSVSDGNLKFTGSATNWSGVYSSIKIPSTGKWYAECVVGSTTSNSNQIIFGFQTFQPLSYNVTNFYGHGHNNGFFLYNNGTASTNGGFATPAGTLLQIAIDADAGKAWYGYNNNWYDTYNTTNGDPSAGTNPYATGINFSTSDFYFVLRSYVNNGSINFGQRPFKYTPPTGFKKLNTYNLPDSTIVDGSQYFDTKLWTGTGSPVTLTGVEFSPDFAWNKDRTAANAHTLYDSVRGVQKELISSSTGAESTETNGLTAFTSDGVTYGTRQSQSGNSQVTWLWRGSDSSPVTNTDGTITSTVSANTNSGFSVVTYTGNATSGATIGHGLGVAPKMVIIKNRTTTSAWRVGHNSLPSWEYILNLSDTGDTGPISSIFNSTAPNSSVVTLGNNTSSNASGNNFVAYCFADVEGFSKFSSYTGNGSTDGPLVYCGFKPAFILLKNSNTTNGWGMFDVKRDTYNIVNQYLEPNASSAEATYVNWQFDFLSNGFKVRSSTAEANGSGNTIIFMAFASNPFKNSLAQ